jgi:butyrate kinase
LGRQTTDATPTVLASNSLTASTTNQVILPNNSAYYVKGSVIATVTGGGNTKSWDFIATIKRGANAAATSIVGAVILNTIAQDAGASTWVVAVTADTTNGGLAVTVTGQAATTIRWVCKLESTEVTY